MELASDMVTYTLEMSLRQLCRRLIVEGKSLRQFQTNLEANALAELV